MAKTAKPKPRPTLRSRAAKRASSPSATIPLPRPEEKPTSEKLAALSARHGAANAGVQKRKTGKALSRQKRKRKEAAVDKAGAVLEKLERRREVSAKKGGVVKGRSTDWDNLNEMIEEEVEKAVEEGKEILVK
ncbi:hypothetical protein L873DRAFT_1828665 [Choiromyces venosus 120613-1]|uniref:Ribosome biogenesis protein Alb1 n=1 Tax=Choiromyces venosus 120613-1 TaxID=1336337 RepID=A0A3N4JIR8_9PEZI|nr:hypothetical protein L873DRAFT_1828665 [Choiromyces venosus 120613-1]